MIFKFSKEIVEKYLVHGHGYFNNVRLYKVFDDKNQLGEFAQFKDTCYLNLEGTSLRIRNESTNIFKSTYVIIDHRSQTKIGKYSISGWIGQYGKLIFGHDIFYCEKLKPELKYSLFKKKTWGQYKIQVSNGASCVIYKFKIDAPFFTFSTMAKYRPFNGEIELFNGNMLLLFAGLFFLDIVIDNEDSNLG